MAERRKNKKKKESDMKDLNQKPSKDEYAVASYLKQKLPEKKTTLLGHKVGYFIACRAVDCLLESHWAKGNKKSELHFNNRDSCIDFMAKLLEHKFFHRAKKIVVQKEPKKKKKETEDVAAESGKESKESESKKAKNKSDSKEKKEDKKDDKESKKEASESEKKKEKKKIKLDMHLEQIFIDSNEPYVWIYDPIPLRTWITGTLMVIGAVLICLFPLWPQTIRHYIYYLSVAAAFFLVFIIGLAVFRLVFFVIVWIVTLGKHHIWLLPNLTEDVGFFESFWPLYKYEYKGPKKEDKKDSSKEKKETQEPKEESQEKEAEKSDASSADQNHSESEQESEGEKTKAENDFEFLEAEDDEEEDQKSDEDDSKSNEEDRKTK